jgi:16S rRNA (cytosine967-C5)-methyltransferase
MSGGASVRLAAVRATMAVLERGQSLSRALPAVQAGLDTPAERALCQQLVYGALRHHRRLDALASALLSKRLRSRDRDVHHALMLGLYQLDALAIPAHAAVAETVEVARSLNKPWAVKLLNAVLRRFQREREGLVATVEADHRIRSGLPDWLYDALAQDWPQQLEAIAAAGARHPPMTLRVNRLRRQRDGYRAELAQTDIDAAPVPHLADALTLAAPVPVDRLPGFAAGDVSVQDGAAQFAAPLLAPRAGARVLDACAAPGGKTAHLLERDPELRLTAVESDPDRAQRLQGTLQRLGLTAEVKVADAARPDTWWDGHLFDAILLDAPCSGTGVIRRHPDIPWLRRPGDIQELAAVQRALLDALWPLLVRGGRLVYATCSILRAENEAVVSSHCARHTDAVSVPCGLPVGMPLAVGTQLLPGEHDLDGFYYACLEKRE